MSANATAVDHQAIDRQTKSKILRSAAVHADGASPHLALPEIAHRHHMTLETVKAVVYAHGWPKAASMLRAADILDRRTGEAEERAELEFALPEAATEILEQVPVDQLRPDPNNIRDDLGDLSELAASIRDVGILQPIVARRHAGHLVIVMGHRRHAAAKKAGVARVPVVIRAGDMDPDEVLAAMILENGQRLNLDPIEEARAFSRLKRADQCTDLMLGDRVRKSQGYVSGRLALLSLTPQQQAAVRAGTLPLNRAIKLGREQGGITKPTAQGKKSAAHLTWHHPLAEKVAVSCQTLGHSKNMPGRVGSVGCGQCWEDQIRLDERNRIEAQGAAR